MAQQNPADLGQHRTQWPLAILLLVVLGAAFGYLVYRDYELSMSRERDSLLAHARVIDENLSQQLSGASAALTNVRDDVVALIKSGQEAQISNRLKALSDAMPGVRTMLAIDVSGKVIGASRADLMGLDLGKRPYLQQPKAHPALDTLYVSEPFTTVFGITTNPVELVLVTVV